MTLHGYTVTSVKRPVHQDQTRQSGVLVLRVLLSTVLDLGDHVHTLP